MGAQDPLPLIHLRQYESPLRKIPSLIPGERKILFPRARRGEGVLSGIAETRYSAELHPHPAPARSIVYDRVLFRRFQAA
eukprot:12219677-Heterocapsa_arctica.AAC.1